ncbi:hypothetical protein [[Kitasatospora] papulosa]|uniref:hypothetical protein n=1 Tax=[Kitasatospora] papulosa TaxID=1464011 RepID=UPI0036840F33
MPPGYGKARQGRRPCPARSAAGADSRGSRCRTPAAYLVLSFRAGTLAMVIGLGPLTLLRPMVVPAACLGAVLDGGGWSSPLVGAIAGAAVLCVEPVVHRRWCHQVL